MRFFLILIFLPIAHDFHWGNAQHRAYGDLIQLKVKSAAVDSLASFPEKEGLGISIYLENYRDVIRLLATEDPVLYEEWSMREKERLSVLKKLDKNSPYFQFVQAEIKLQWALVKFKFGDEWSGFWGFRRAYLMLLDNEERFPDFLPQKKSLGALRVVLSTVPPRYQWLMGLFSLKGDLKKGLIDLEELAKSNSSFAQEARLYKGYLQAYILQEADEAYPVFREAFREQPDNLFLAYATTMIALKANKGYEALSFLEKIPQGGEYCDLIFFDYLKSNVYLQTGHFEKAIEVGKQFLENYKGVNYRKDACLRIFLAHWLQDSPEAQAWLERTRTEGESRIGVDKHAKRFANYDRLPHKKLTHARLLTDGGLYNKAQSILESVDRSSLQNKKDSVEWFYRQARIAHKTEDFQIAKQLYNQTLNAGQYLPHYFAPQSALQLGFLYRDHFKKVEKAKVYFERTLTFSGYEYETAIRQQAEAALATLEGQ